MSSLDLGLQKPKFVYITQGTEEECKITRDTLRLFNPGVVILDHKIEHDTSVIVLNAGSIVINEIPFMMNQTPNYLFNIQKENIEYYKESLINSTNPKHIELCIILKWRLQNFLVELYKNGKKIKNNNKNFKL